MPENKGEMFLSPEITKLAEKLQKDPSSKLFFPLAEEYIKCNMLEEAIIVLREGLKIHSGFHAARVSLGKVYLQKGQVAEAKIEFEKVVAQNPDNLMAQKKLAFIYSQEGNIQKAKQIGETILSVNPKDLEMKKLLAELETSQAQQSPQAAQATGQPAPAQAVSQVAEQLSKMEEKLSASVVSLDQAAPDLPSPLPATTAPSGSLTQQQNAAPTGNYEAEPIGTVPLQDQVQEPIPLEAQKRPDVQEPILSTDLQAPASPPQDQPVGMSPPPQDNRQEDLGEPAVPVVELDLDAVDSGQNEDDIFSELLGASGPKPQSPKVQESLAPTTSASPSSSEEEGGAHVGLEGDLTTVTLAELYVKQGHYEQGIEIYRKILEHDPDDEEVRQRLEDALALANLLTKRPKDSRPKEVVPVQEPSPGPPATSAPNQSVRTTPEHLRQAKVQRLQAWLEQLRRSQNP